jgi:hypothetical protein
MFIGDWYRLIVNSALMDTPTHAEQGIEYKTVGSIYNVMHRD